MTLLMVDIQPCEKYIEERPASIEQAIYTRFYNIEQVQSIYAQSLPEVYNIFVFLKQDHYDDELMDRLLDREGEILDSYHDNLFHFHYLPLLGDTRPRAARQVESY